MACPDILHHGVTGSCHQLQMDAQHSLLIHAETSPEGKSVADRLAIDFLMDTIKALVAHPCAYRSRRAHLLPVGRRFQGADPQ